MSFDRRGLLDGTEVGDSAALGDVEVVDDGSKDPSRHSVEARRPVDRARSRDDERGAEIGERERGLRAAPGFDHGAGQLVDRDPEVFDVLDVKPETRGDGRGSQAHDSDVIERAWYSEVHRPRCLRVLVIELVVQRGSLQPSTARSSSALFIVERPLTFFSRASLYS